jgi:hypothetical protein
MATLDMLNRHMGKDALFLADAGVPGERVWTVRRDRVPFAMSIYGIP